LPGNIELYEDYKAGRFAKLGDIAMAEELLLMLEHLDGITSTVKSDHILNLLQEVEGTLPGDREKMLAPLKAFLALE
nr:radical SAM protein [Desulfuromonadales bacterium]